jgi:hypothetical protein
MIDAAAYVIVNAFLIGIWYYTGAKFPWFVFVLVGSKSASLFTTTLLTAV